MIQRQQSNPEGPGPPVVSVIIPAYQEEALIGGILSQFTPELRKRLGVQLIVSDGGSTDRTPAIAAAHADVVVRNTDGHRQTIAEGRNRGADEATGDLILFLNADVRAGDPEGLIAAVVRTFRDPRTVAATCAVLVEPSEATRFDRAFHPAFNAWCRFLSFLGAGMGRGECQAVRSELFRRAGGYNETLAAAEDYDLFRRLARRGRIAFIAGVTVFESPRRYRRLGYPRVLADWFLNALSVAFRGTSRSKEWDPVR